MRRVAAFVIAAVLLAGCQTAPGAGEDDYEPGLVAGERGPQTDADAGPVDDGSPSCPASAYQVLVGQPIGEIHTQSLPEPHRIYGRGDMVTMDHRPDRLNIVTGEDGAVVEVKCG
ncbi:MAG: I78 family peptidase inhibitor [Oceanicaulis sp.]